MERGEEQQEWALCLSGGGFRATIFHLGALRRLNELGVLSRLSTITSVSGGSILNGLLATRWSKLRLDSQGVYSNFEEQIAEPMRTFCQRDLRTSVLLGTRLNVCNWGKLLRDWFSVSGDFLAQAYEPFYQAKLADISAPGPRIPRFIFCATNFRTGACWHFHGGPAARMGDFYTGYCEAGSVRVSEAVAASSAFPPGFSPLRLKLPPGRRMTRQDPWGDTSPISSKRGDENYSESEPIFLTDGGVYDNLGVEPVWTRPVNLLVSDAGRPFDATDQNRQSLVSRLNRAAYISMEQVRGVRLRWLVTDFQTGRREGTVWTLHTKLKARGSRGVCRYSPEVAEWIKRIRTDLNQFTEGEIAALENHGYSLADAVIRQRTPGLCQHPNARFAWPHEAWSDGEKVVQALVHSSKRMIWRDVWRYLLRG